MHNETIETTKTYVVGKDFIIGSSIQQGQTDSIKVIQHLNNETKAASDWATQATIPAIALMGLAALVSLFLRKL